MMEGGGMFVQVSPDSVAAAGETVGLSNLPGNKQIFLLISNILYNHLQAT